MSDAFSISPFMKSSSHPYFSNTTGANFLPQDDNEDLFRVSRTASPPLIFEMVFEKQHDSSSHEENMNEGNYFRSSEDWNFFGDASLIKPEAFDFDIERNGAMIEEEEENSECSGKEAEEELASISTKESFFTGFPNIDSEYLSQGFEDTYSTFAEIEFRVQAKALEMAKNKTRQEREYIEQILPMAIEALKSVCAECSCNTLTDSMIENILIELLESRKALLGAEAQLLKSLVGREIEDIQKERPCQAIGEDDLNLNRRKARKTFKGNKNNSTLNHVNENYVSNIFQFAKKNFPEDQELQRLANERNVSALNFRRFMHCRMTDSALRRRAKARMLESGKELLNNVEYWMSEGYFDQCTEREKYIAQKQKALIDLALDEKY
jgi:hypothetical protein